VYEWQALSELKLNSYCYDLQEPNYQKKKSEKEKEKEEEEGEKEKEEEGGSLTKKYKLSYSEVRLRNG
jgi:hypothetical protein